MSESQQQTAVISSGRSESSLRVYTVVLSVGLICSLAIVSTYQWTRPIIQQKKIAARQQAILEVLPAAKTSAVFQWDESGRRFHAAVADAEGTQLVFAGFDQRGELVGWAIETRGMGYQDYIRLLYGYSPDEQAIIGIRVLESRETPGLGDRIETDPDYLRNFAHLDVRLNAEGTQLAHAIEFVKHGQKTADWQIDGITGATISSRGTAEAVRDSAAYWIPRLHSQISDFRLPQRKE